MRILNRYAIFIGLGLVAAYGIALAVGKTASGEDNFGVNVIQTIAALYSSVLLYGAYRQTSQKYWLYYGIGVFCYFAAMVPWDIVQFVTGHEPDKFGASEVLWMMQYVFILFALFVQNKASERKPALHFSLDVILFTTVVASLYWRYLIEPVVKRHAVPNENVVFDIFCSSANAVAVFVLLIMFIYERKSAHPKATLVLIFGFLLKSLGNTIVLFISREESLDKLLYWLPDLCWFLGLVLLGYAAHYGNKETSPVPERRAIFAEERFFHRRYVPMIVVCVLILAFLWNTMPVSVALVGVTITFVLLLLRVMVGIRDYETADKALQESIGNYRNLVENSLVGVFIEQDGELVYVNPYCESLFGYDPGEMIGKPMYDFFAEREHARVTDQYAKLSDNGTTSRQFFECVRKDHSVFQVDLQAARTVFHGKKAISGTLLDITERRIAEQMLIRSEKLSVVGQLAAGVAHEIRNPLTALKGFTQLLLKNSDENHNYYQIMLSELERINYIVGEFMVLSKPHHWQQLNSHDLQIILAGIIPIIDSQAIIHSVSLQVEWSTDLPQVRCDANQIKQVFLNLLKNAIESMQHGGNISIRFENIFKEHVIVSIADEGTGIPQEILQRLGEPFLSTKETGTGLGLMVCYKIIQSHGGSLVVNSKPGQGTVVRIALPAESEEATA